MTHTTNKLIVNLNTTYSLMYIIEALSFIQFYFYNINAFLSIVLLFLKYNCNFITLNIINIK